jgi:hypothetical protein
MPPETPSGKPPRRQRHRLLLLLPFAWQIGMVPVVNDIAWRPFSMPFPMVWQMAGVIVASICIAVVFTLDKRAGIDNA